MSHINPDNVAALIVTYGSRVEFLRQVVDAVLAESPQLIVIVDNNSDSATRHYLSSICHQYSAIQVASLSENTGSSGGYSHGLAAAFGHHAVSAVWCLDDDNVPLEGSLAALLSALDVVRPICERAPILFSSRLTFDDQNSQAVEFGVIKEQVRSIKSVLANRYREGREAGRINYPIVRTMAGPFGGMLLLRDVFESLGCPDTRYFTYGDDFEYCNRATRLGYDLFLVGSSKIVDVDTSSDRGNHYFGPDIGLARLYYGTRNHIHLRTSIIGKWKTYPYVLLFSIYVYYSALKSILNAPKKVLSRIHVFHLAIMDGLNGRLGKWEQRVS
jgi:GT2 family glycosyltransferase